MPQSPWPTRIAAVFLGLHGCAHVLGFLAWWQVAAFGDPLDPDDPLVDAR